MQVELPSHKNNTFPSTSVPRCPLAETFGDVLKSPGLAFLLHEVSGSLDMTLMHDADYRPYASLPTDPDHMTPDLFTTPAALGVNDEEKDVTFPCATETDGRDVPEDSMHKYIHLEVRRTTQILSRVATSVNVWQCGIIIMSKWNVVRRPSDVKWDIKM